MAVRGRDHQTKHADANTYPFGFSRICIGVLFFTIMTADKRCLSLQARMAAGVYLRVRWGSDVPDEKPKQNENPRILRAAGNPKGVRPFWSF